MPLISSELSNRTYSSNSSQHKIDFSLTSLMRHNICTYVWMLKYYREAIAFKQPAQGGLKEGYEVVGGGGDGAGVLPLNWQFSAKSSSQRSELTGEEDSDMMDVWHTRGVLLRGEKKLTMVVQRAQHASKLLKTFSITQHIWRNTNDTMKQTITLRQTHNATTHINTMYKAATLTDTSSSY